MADYGTVTHAPNVDEVRSRTHPLLNVRIDRQAQERVADTAGGPAVADRLHELDDEWDFERVIEAEASATGLIGLALGAAVHRGFLFIPGFAAAMMLLHAVDGWYPLLPALRRLGVRT